MNKFPKPHLGAELSNEETVLMHVRTRPEVNLYFHRMALTKGWRQSILDFFMEAYHAECVAAGIPSTWDVEREDQLATILLRLNFKSVEAEIQPKLKKKNGPAKQPRA